MTPSERPVSTPDRGWRWSSPNLASDAGWREAAAGCRYVLHVASPFPATQPKDPQEVIVPARDGAIRVLRAGLDADVERIVLTSSIAAVREGPHQLPRASIHRSRLDQW